MDSETKKLTPLKFLPDKQDTPWGSIEYKLADLGFIDSMASEGWLGGNTIGDIMQTYLERVSGETSFNWYGTQFPVLVKRMHVKGCTPLHLNPDDEAAEQRYDAFGKTVLWYVEDAGKDAALYLGFKKEVGAAQLYEAGQDGSITSLLHKVKPSKGEFYLITPGMVHSAKDVTLLEVSEASELSFNLDTDLEEAFDLVDMGAWRNPLPKPEGTLIVSLPQFTVNAISLSQALKSHRDEDDTFLIYITLEGEAVIQAHSNNYKVAKGDLIMIPAEVQDFALLPAAPGTVLLEVRMDPRPENDIVSEPIDDGSQD